MPLPDPVMWEAQHAATLVRFPGLSEPSFSVA